MFARKTCQLAIGVCCALALNSSLDAQERLPPLDGNFSEYAPRVLQTSLVEALPPAPTSPELNSHEFAHGHAPSGSPTATSIVAAQDQRQSHLANPAHLTAARQPAADSDLEERLRLLEQNQDRLEAMFEYDEFDDNQDGPGDAYTGPDYDPLPAYVYEPYYFDTWGIGARPIADYAPPGYEPRDQQVGPATPEFRRILPPAAITADEREDLVVRGTYPGSYLAPGTNTSFRLRGFVRLAALYDFDPIGSTDSFVPNTIPVPQQIGENFNMSGRISRFALETWTPTDFCDWNVHTFIEGDFFNGAAQAAGGGGNPFRLRHAFFDFGYFRFGQQNTTFMDASNWPSLVDFQGPNSWVNQRQPSARVTLSIAHGWYWAASVERCFSDITTNGLGVAVQEVPDFASHVRYETYVGHVQIAGLVRNISYRPTGGAVEHLTASGVSGSFVFHPWAIVLGTNPVLDDCPSDLTRSRILLQCTSGAGVGRYINDLAGQGLDAQVNPITGEFELVDAFGWNASYEHWFNDHWLANFTYADLEVDNNPNQPGGTYASARYQAASLWWIPVPRLAFAVEYIWGDRENLDGQDGHADRLHGLAQYNF